MVPQAITSTRSRRLRSILALAGLLLFFFGLAALIYVNWPSPVEQVQQTLPASLFSPP